MLRQALALWRGVPLAGLSGDWAEQTRQLWQQRRIDATVEWAQEEMGVGNTVTVIGALRTLCADFPLVEPLAATMMRALALSGREAEALEYFSVVRARLSADLGVEPCDDVQKLHYAILRGEVTRPPNTSPAPSVSAAPVRTPALLPPDVAGFVARQEELAQLDAVLAQFAREPAIVAVCGTAGVGKTALALHWAHRVRDRFPDGQLYVNLRGFDHAGTVMAPAEAIRRFLDALNEPAQRIPADPQAQADLYRTLLADKAMLIVLDNARDPDQVRPLLPGAPGCLIVVTSRNRLAGLVAAAGAHPLPLDLLTLDQARDLLTRRLGPARVTAEPDPVDELIQLCARLPLALAIVAAHAATHRGLPLAALAEQLRDTRDRLDVLSTSDTPITDVRAVFSWSYQALGQEPARLFRLLGLHPGPDVSTAAAASLAAQPIERTRPLLNELAGAHLINEHTPGRYTFHDLLRAYAAELAHTTESDPQRHAAIHRMLDHYLHTAYEADRQVDSHRRRITLSPPQPGVIVPALNHRNEATAWLTDEQPILLAAVTQAAQAGFDTHSCQLAWALAPFLDLAGHWQQWVTTQRTAVQAAQRAGDSSGLAMAHGSLGLAFLRLDRLDEACEQYQHSLTLFEQLDDPRGRANAHYNLGVVAGKLNRLADAVKHTRQTHDLYRDAGNTGGQASALNAIGWLHAELGEYEPALAACRQALDLFEHFGDRQGAADTWDTLGYVHHQLGRHHDATASYERALQLYREFGDRYHEAQTLTRLGATSQAAGDRDAARLLWGQALSIYEDLQHSSAEELRGKLNDLAC